MTVRKTCCIKTVAFREWTSRKAGSGSMGSGVTTVGQGVMVAL